MDFVDPMQLNNGITCFQIFTIRSLVGNACYFADLAQCRPGVDAAGRQQVVVIVKTV